MNNQAFVLHVGRTLYDNLYSVRVFDAQNNPRGMLRVIPQFPLDRSVVPADAPEAKPFLLVIVDDADINKDNLIDFEERASSALLSKFATDDAPFMRCQFYYPSPAFIFTQEGALESDDDKKAMDMLRS